MITTAAVPTGIAILVLAVFPSGASGYSVLTHEAIIDTLWVDAILPVLTKRFPEATQELNEAHGYAYGGCIIQDLGYYPFGSHLFSDLAHYVRSGDFIQSLIDNAQDLDEYAFALGAVAHYGADLDGHAIAVNRAVPMLYPKLRKKFGNSSGSIEVRYPCCPVIEDLKNGEIMISGTPSDFVVRVRGREYYGRVGIRAFDSDLKHLLDRFSYWLTEIDRQAREASNRRPRYVELSPREAVAVVMRSLPRSQRQ